MKIKINYMVNLADVLEVINMLSERGLHFMYNERNNYYFESDNSKRFKYVVFVRTLTNEDNKDDSYNCESRIIWDVFYTWIMKIPGFCVTLEMYKLCLDKSDTAICYNNKLSVISSTICETVFFGVETAIYIFLFFCYPDYLPNFFLYYFGFLILNMLFYKGIRIMLKNHLIKKVQRITKNCD